MNEIREKRLDTSRVIIFCHSYEDVGHILFHEELILGKDAVEPVGAPDMARFRLVDMFTACTEKSEEWDSIVRILDESYTGDRLLILKIIFKKRAEQKEMDNTPQKSYTTLKLIYTHCILMLALA